MYRCGGCRRVTYCSHQCAETHWDERHSLECIGLQGDDDVIGLEAGDGTRIEIPRVEAEKMTTIKYLLEDAGPEDYIPLPNILGETLRLIERFIRGDLSEKMDDQTYFNLLMAANYLDFKDLIIRLMPTFAKRLLTTKLDIEDIKSIARTLKGLLAYAPYFLSSLSELAKFTNQFGVERYESIRNHMIKFGIQVYNEVNQVYDWILKNWVYHWILRNSIKNELLLEFLVQFQELFPPAAIFKFAMKNGYTKAVQILLKDGRVDPNPKALELASRRGHLKIVQLLLQDDRFNPSFDDNAAIQEAVEGGHEDIVQLLLQDGRADPSADNNEAIRRAAGNGHVGVVRLLLQDERVNPSAQDNEAIQRAARNGHVEVVRLLLQDKRVNPSADNNYAIQWAAINGRVEVVRLLLQDGRADPSAWGNDAIRYAAKNGHVEVVRLLLQDKRVNPSADDSFAIQIAAAEGYLEMVRLLLQDERVDVERIKDSPNPEIQALYREFSSQKRHKIGMKIIR